MNKVFLKRPLLVVVILASISSLAIFLLSPEKKIERPPPLRLVQLQEKDRYELQVPIVHYTRRDKLTSKRIQVDFVGAVHLGESDYYEELNKRFKGYEAVLFELIADSNRIKDLKSQSSGSTLGTIQRKMAEFLGLTFQLDKVDYQAPNFVHADMTPEQLVNAMQARGESFAKLLWKLFQLSFDPKLQKSLEEAGLKPEEIGDINPLMIIIRGPTADERIRLKRFMAKGLVGAEELLKLLEGDGGSSIITDRNKIALSVLDQQISKGLHNFAIFYGSGHLPDMHERLTKEMGFKITGVEWIDAWRV